MCLLSVMDLEQRKFGYFQAHLLLQLLSLKTEATDPHPEAVNGIMKRNIALERFVVERMPSAWFIYKLATVSQHTTPPHLSFSC